MSSVKNKLQSDVKKDSKSMRKNFLLVLKEIESVLKGKKPVTDKTWAASATLSTYAHIKSRKIRGIPSRPEHRRQHEVKNKN